MPVTADAFLRNDAAHRALAAGLRERLAGARAGGPPQARQRHIARGKLLPRDRIDALLDPGSPLLEIGALAANRLDRGLSVVRAYDVVPLASKCIVQQLNQIAVVIDDQQFHCAPASSFRCLALGSVKCTEVP